MVQEDFTKYVPVLRQAPFELIPAPMGIDQNVDRFKYLEHNTTHVKIAKINTDMELLIPLAVVDFANPGVLKLTRKMGVYNAALV